MAQARRPGRPRQYTDAAHKQWAYRKRLETEQQEQQALIGRAQALAAAVRKCAEGDSRYAPLAQDAACEGDEWGILNRLVYVFSEPVLFEILIR